MQKYPPIHDWTPEGRAALVSASRDHVVLLLDEAFTRFFEEPGSSLAAYGFRGVDPVSQATAFALHRFEHGHIDPELLRAEDSSFRLFTRAAFWLAQKVGKVAFERIQAQSRAQEVVACEVVPASTPVRFDGVRERIVTTARELSRRTSPMVVQWWLRGTQRDRREWFGPRSDATVPPPESVSAKNASLRIADALFRFVCLLLDEVAEEETADRACALSWFSPWEESPFRVPVGTLAVLLSVSGPREAGRLRRDGARALVRRVASALSAPPTAIDGRIAHAWTRIGVLHAWRIDEPELRVELAAALGRGQ